MWRGAWVRGFELLGLRPSQPFMAIFECETSAEVHEMLVWGIISGSLVQSLHYSCRNYRWGDSILWSKQDLRSYLIKFSWESCPQTPPLVSTYALLVRHHNGSTNLKKLAPAQMLHLYQQSVTSHVYEQAWTALRFNIQWNTENWETRWSQNLERPTMLFPQTETKPQRLLESHQMPKSWYIIHTYTV